MNTITRKLTLLTLTASLLGFGTAFAAPASENYEAHCQKCHGADGKSQTKTGKKLNAPDFTSADYKKSFDEKKVFSVIRDGVKKDGKERHKAFTDLSEAEVKDLVAYVKALK